MADMDWQDKVKWDANGLVPVIAQEALTGKVLMVAWMNRAALAQTVAGGEAVYWSRSRRKLWHKGGIACHTGRHNCFFQKYADGRWVVTDPVIKDPKDIYQK